MNNWLSLSGLAGAVLLLGCSSAVAQTKPGPSLADFVPPARGGSTAVEGPTRKVDGRIEAKDLQSGLNAGLAELLKSPKASGVIGILVPSGFGVLAIGRTKYDVFENRTATLVSKRAAYLAATAEAQKELVGYAKGVQSACERGASLTVEDITTGTGSKANVSQSTRQSCEDQIAGVLRAYVTYRVDDDPASKEVYVALASSPATRGALQKVGGAIISASDAKRAFDEVMADIASGVVSPTGARLITSPTTGESYVIGFGSAIVRRNPDPAIARRLGAVAATQAELLARNALVSFLKGDEVYWKGSFRDDTNMENRQFATDASPGAPTAHVVERTRKEFLAPFRLSSDNSSVTKGQVPPGVKSRSFTADGGDWVYAVAVYSNSMTARAQEIEAPAPVSPGSAAPSAAPAAPAERDQGGFKEGGENPKGPSGQVTPDKKL